MRCDLEELVDRAALVGLEVCERDPAQPLDRHDLLDGLAHEREQLAHTRVVEQRLFGVDQELVEGEAGRADVGDERGDAVDAVRDLVNVCVHCGTPFSLVQPMVQSMVPPMWQASWARSDGRTW